MSAPLTKRQRLTDSTNKLKQPFKSPFSKSTINPSSDPTARDQPLNGTPTTTASSSPSKPSLLPHKRTHHFSISSSPVRADPEVTALQKQHTALTSQLNQLRTELDTHTQALKIEISSKDKELERLISLWKGASRSAAEEVYAKVKDRVNRMGGVAAWKERERNSGWGGGWDEEKNDIGHEEEVDERGQAERDDERDGLDKDRVERAKADEVDEDAGFTMDMMLKSLNIGLDFIGFDKEMQRWID